MGSPAAHTGAAPQALIPDAPAPVLPVVEQNLPALLPAHPVKRPAPSPPLPHHGWKGGSSPPPAPARDSGHKSSGSAA